MAVVYVGNAVIDERKTQSRIQRTCKRTKVSEQKLFQQLSQCEKIDDISELLQIGEIVSDYLKILYQYSPQNKADLHWLASLMKRYAEERFFYNISLKEFAITHQKNEKYIGRLFKKETGKSFHEYCMDIRLQKAERLLSQCNEKIINVAFECGFNSLSYFNRSFQKKYGMPPSVYRKTVKN